MADKSGKEYTLTIPAEERKLVEVRDFIDRLCRKSKLGTEDVNNLKIAVDEGMTNIIRHAYLYSGGEIYLRGIVTPGRVTLSLVDHGQGFDWESVKSPDLTRYMETGRRGGLGIFLIRNLMDEVDYRVTREGNELRLTKYASRRGRKLRFLQKTVVNITLRMKFVLLASFLMGGIIIGAYAYFSHRSEVALLEEMLTRGRQVCESLANGSIDYLIKPNELLLNALVSDLVRDNEDVAYAMVLDNQDLIWAHNMTANIMKHYTPPEGLNPTLTRTPQKYRIGGRYFWDVAVPIVVKDVRIGTARVGIRDEAIRQRMIETRKGVLFVMIGIFLFGFIIIILFSSHLVKPIQRLIEGVKAVGEGDLDHRVFVETDDEVGKVAAAFNEMTKKFKVAQKRVVEQERLQKEMQVAQEIQHTLLPKRFPEIEGYDISTLYRAAKEVGGDYYDFVWIDRDTLGIVVADVSGKGVPGSLVMTMIRTALRLEARANRSPSDVVRRVNSFVSEDMKKGMFVTIFYVVLDSKRRRISYSSAGHNPMILYRSKTDKTYFLNPSGIPVGIDLPEKGFFAETLSSERIRLRKDDMLIIYTDGITETMNRNREQFGEEKLLAFIKKHSHSRPKEFVKQLDEEIASFTGGIRQHDDITLVVIKEKLSAEEVLYKVRTKLFRLVEKEGMSVRQACEEIGIAPSTYYRYRKIREKYGDEALAKIGITTGKEPRQISVEERNKIFQIIKEHPKYGSVKISRELDTEKYGHTQIVPYRIYQELKQLGLSRVEEREEFAKSEEKKLPHRWVTKKRIPEKPAVQPEEKVAEYLTREAETPLSLSEEIDWAEEELLELRAEPEPFLKFVEKEDTKDEEDTFDWEQLARKLKKKTGGK